MKRLLNIITSLVFVFLPFYCFAANTEVVVPMFILLTYFLMAPSLLGLFEYTVASKRFKGIKFNSGLFIGFNYLIIITTTIIILYVYWLTTFKFFDKNYISGFIFMTLLIVSQTWSKSKIYKRKIKSNEHKNFLLKVIFIETIIVNVALLMLLISCSTISYRTFDTNPDPDRRIQLFKDSTIVCLFSEDVTDHYKSFYANITLNFIPESDTQIEITNIRGQIKWRHNGQVSLSPFHPISILIFASRKDSIYKDSIFDRLRKRNPDFDYNTVTADSTFNSMSDITDYFKILSGINSKLEYTITFGDPTSDKLPHNVDKLVIDLQIEIKANGKTKKYNNTIDLYPKKESYSMFF